MPCVASFFNRSPFYFWPKRDNDMEHRMNLAMASHLHEQFQGLASYQEKVHFFDRQWGLLPFHPPPFDPALSWLFDPSPSFNLLDLFLLEIDRRKNFYTKTHVFEGQIFTASVNPFSKHQRIALNQAILNKFLSAFATWERHAAKQAMPPSAWEGQLEEANATLARLRGLAAEKAGQDMHARFLQVFLKGYADKTVHEQVLNRRKRFVELFLYAHGLLYAQYTELLQKKVAAFKAHPHTPPPLLSQKLKLMEKLGFFHFLKPMLCNEKRSKSQLIKTIHFLLSDSKTQPTSDENLLIENFLLTTNGKGEGANRPLH